MTKLNTINQMLREFERVLKPSTAKEIRGLNTIETVKRDLEIATNPRVKAFSLLSYSRLTDEAREYLQNYVNQPR